MDTQQTPLKILHISWGEIEVEKLGKGKDFKLWPGGGRSWDWRETGTQHSPGIQISDVAELVEEGCQVIILTRGRLRRLKIQPDTLNYLEEKGVEVIVSETKKGVTLYNELVKIKSRVGGLFHSTC